MTSASPGITLATEDWSIATAETDSLLDNATLSFNSTSSQTVSEFLVSDNLTTVSNSSLATTTEFLPVSSIDYFSTVLNVTTSWTAITDLTSTSFPHINLTQTENYTTETLTMDLNATTMTDTSPFLNGISFNYQLPAMIVVAVVLFIVIIITAFGNFLVGLALYKFRNLRTISNYLIGNLALSDFLLACTILPFSSVNECLGYWVFGEVLCNVWLLLDVLYCTASIWNLCVIGLDRFTATIYPMWYREKRSAKQAGIYIATVWMVSTCITIPPLLGWNDISQNYFYDNSTNVYQCLPFQTPSFVLYSASGSFYVPFLITVFLYIRIFQVLKQRMKKMRDRNKKTNFGNTQANKKLLPTKKEEIAIELSNVQAEGVTCTEEVSSRSLFGSNTDSQEKSDPEDDDSSAHVRSDQPLCVSSSDMDTAPAKLRNGIKDKGKPSEMLVIMNPNHQFTDSEKESDREHIQIIITEEDSAKDGNSDNSLSKSKHNNHKDSKRLATLHTLKVNNNTGKEARKGLMQQFRSKNVNIFKLKSRMSKNKEKSRQSQKRRVDQREMRATIRMAIIIACFCGCWIGFFVTYVIHSWCPVKCYIPRAVDAFFFWLGYANSSMNPILYAIFNEEFRRAFQRLLGCYGRSLGSNSNPSGKLRH